MKIEILGILIVLMAMSGISLADDARTTQVDASFTCPTTFTVYTTDPLPLGAAVPGSSLEVDNAFYVDVVGACGGYKVEATTDQGTATIPGRMTQVDGTQLIQPFFMSKGEGWVDMYYQPLTVLNSATSGTAYTRAILAVKQDFGYDDVPGNYWIKVVLTFTPNF